MFIYTNEKQNLDNAWKLEFWDFFVMHLNGATDDLYLNIMWKLIEIFSKHGICSTYAFFHNITMMSHLSSYIVHVHAVVVFFSTFSVDSV